MVTKFTGEEGDDRPCKKVVDQSWGISWKRDTRKGSRFNRSIACDLYLSFPRFEFLRVIYSGSLCIANFGSENLMERKMKGAFPFQRRIFIPSTSGIWFGQDGSDPWEVISICPEIFLNGCRDRGRAIFPSFSTGLWGSYGERHNIEMPVRDSNNGYIYPPRAIFLHPPRITSVYPYVNSDWRLLLDVGMFR